MSLNNFPISSLPKELRDQIIRSTTKNLSQMKVNRELRLNLLKEPFPRNVQQFKFSLKTIYDGRVLFEIIIFVATHRINIKIKEDVILINETEYSMNFIAFQSIILRMISKMTPSRALLIRLTPNTIPVAFESQLTGFLSIIFDICEKWRFCKQLDLYTDFGFANLILDSLSRKLEYTSLIFECQASNQPQNLQKFVSKIGERCEILSLNILDELSLEFFDWIPSSIKLLLISDAVSDMDAITSIFTQYYAKNPKFALLFNVKDDSHRGIPINSWDTNRELHKNINKIDGMTEMDPKAELAMAFDEFFRKEDQMGNLRGFGKFFFESESILWKNYTIKWNSSEIPIMLKTVHYKSPYVQEVCCAMWAFTKGK